MLANYIAMWRGDWGVINQIYIVIYTVMLYPMMCYLVYKLIQGVWRERKTGKKSSKFN